MRRLIPGRVVSGRNSAAVLTLCRGLLTGYLLSSNVKGGHDMDQIQIGSFLKTLRLEKSLTQEQLADQFGVTGRTVSRWENGNNLPDISILVELADFYDVDIRELIDGSRKSEDSMMSEDLKDTLVKVSDYTSAEKASMSKNILWNAVITLVLGAAAMAAVILKETGKIANSHIYVFLMCIITNAVSTVLDIRRINDRMSKRNYVRITRILAIGFFLLILLCILIIAADAAGLID